MLRPSRRRSPRRRSGSIIVVVGVSTIVLLMSSCLIFDYAVMQSAKLRLDHSIELAILGATKQLGPPTAPMTPESPWLQAFWEAALGDGVTAQEQAASRITCDGAGFRIVIMREVDVLFPSLAGMFREPSTGGGACLDFALQLPGTPPPPFEGFDDQGRYHEGPRPVGPAQPSPDLDVPAVPAPLGSASSSGSLLLMEPGGGGLVHDSTASAPLAPTTLLEGILRRGMRTQQEWRPGRPTVRPEVRTVRKTGLRFDNWH